MVKEIDEKNFHEIIENNEIVLIDFWAEWCGPCRMFGPVFEKVSEKHDDIVFAKCNIETAAELAAGFGVRSIPTIAVLKNSTVVYLQPGALDERGLEELIKGTKALEMKEALQEKEYAASESA